VDFGDFLGRLWESTGIMGFMAEGGAGMLVMIAISLVLIWLAIAKGFEPLLLIPIGFGGILANIPFAEIARHTEMFIQPGGTEVIIEYGGLLGQFFDFGLSSGLFPVLIFMGVGAMTDFGPLIANPKTALLGAAAQFGIFLTLFGAISVAPVGEWLNALFNLTGENAIDLNFNILEAGSIGIIGGADGPTAIFTTAALAPHLLGAIAVAAYSYMALVPIIQPPIMKLLTNKEERQIKMEQLRHVSKTEKIVFPLVVLALAVILLPTATPLLGALMFGNLVKESGVAERLSSTMQNALINIVTIMLGLAVGSKLKAAEFLDPKTIAIIVLGLAAFAVGTASGVLLAKFMNLFSKNKINPLIGSAGVSAVPMAARVSNKVGQEENPQNYLMMHAMGPNVAGVIGSAVAAGVLLLLK
jgi:sodium ion-translocating decarboxylase beta subunit